MPKGMPPLQEAVEPIVEGKGEFNHEQHMQKVKDGLQSILASEDINEIKNIAQSLLSEEENEQKVEEVKAEPTLEDYLGGGK